MVIPIKAAIGDGLRPLLDKSFVTSRIRMLQACIQIR